MNELKADAKFLYPLHRHFISLMCDEHVDGKIVPLNFSAFIVEVTRAWYAITAGHIFTELKEAIAGGAKISNWRIDDSSISETEIGLPPLQTPLDFDKDIAHYLDKPYDGIDFAVVPIDQLAKIGLQKAGITALQSDQWEIANLSSYPQWVLVGVPGQFSKVLPNGKQEKNIVTVGVEHIPRPNNIADKDYERLHARINFSSVVSGVETFDIEGMSGGPIFAIKIESERIFDYKLLGIQSGVSKDGSVIFFCYAAPFLNAVIRAIEQTKG